MHPSQQRPDYSSREFLSFELGSWFLRRTGANFASATNALAKQWLAGTMGNFALELRISCHGSLLAAHSQVHPVFELSHHGNGVRCHFADLPIESRSVELVVAAHVLEFSAAPHAVLREIARVLTPEGTFLLIIFNPYSIHGFQKHLRLSRGVPWSGHYFAPRKIRDWLRLLGFKILCSQGISQPCFHRFTQRFMKGFVAVDKLYDFAGVYAIKAKKQTPGTLLNLKSLSSDVFLDNNSWVRQPTAPCREQS